MTKDGYVPGYTRREGRRLHDQARALAGLLHDDTAYPRGSWVLEAGCGVGAQTAILSARSPLASFTSVDISAESIGAARELLAGVGADNVTLAVADVLALPFDDDSFDHVFCCFLLEHLPDPMRALLSLRRVVRDGGSITAIEGDHGSSFFHPASGKASSAIDCLVESQARLGGNALIGRDLYPLLSEAGFQRVSVSPRMVYVDGSRPELAEGFTRNTFAAMVEGAKDVSIEMGLASEEEFDAGVGDLYRTAEPDGVFCYTFFKGVGWK